ncbi:MAG: SOS response-associated peptidase [Paracoccaceae bacterium]
MCGRFAVGEPDAEAWADWLGVAADSPMPRASWNVAPTQPVAIVRADEAGRRLDLARWGLVPRWWKKPLADMKAATFNARSEEAAEKPMFRDAWARARCLVPALGYYEWTGAKGDKTPWFVTLENNRPGICFAGLWAEARIDGEPLLSATILTCAAGEGTRHLHPRSPVILAEEDWPRWLDPEASVQDLMRPPAPERLRVWQVDRAVGRVQNDGPALVERVGLDL